MTTPGKSQNRLILVVYGDGTHDLVEPYLLDYYLATGRIARFCRESGWVAVGTDPIRKETCRFSGEERRRGKRLSSRRP